VDPVVPDLVPDTPTNADFSCQAEIPKITVDVACQTTPARMRMRVSLRNYLVRSGHWLGY
jgi:hypothetical protein